MKRITIKLSKEYVENFINEKMSKDYEILIIDKDTETLIYKKDGLFKDSYIEFKYHIPKFMGEVFNVFNEKIFTYEPDGVPSNIVYSNNQKITYQIIVDFENGLQRVKEGIYCLEGLPKDYCEFMYIILELIFKENKAFGDIFDVRKYAYNSQRESDIIFCGVVFNDYSDVYHYITDDDSIVEGDEVLVPTGRDNQQTKATVVEKAYYNENDKNIPYPLSKVKKIIGKSISIMNEKIEYIKTFENKKVRLLTEDNCEFIGVLNNIEYDEICDFYTFYIQTEDENIEFDEFEIDELDFYNE